MAEVVHVCTARADAAAVGARITLVWPRAQRHAPPCGEDVALTVRKTAFCRDRSVTGPCADGPRVIARGDPSVAHTRGLADVSHEGSGSLTHDDGCCSGSKSGKARLRGCCTSKIGSGGSYSDSGGGGASRGGGGSGGGASVCGVGADLPRRHRARRCHRAA